MRTIPKPDQCIQIVLCYKFTFIIQIVRQLFHWFHAISFDSDTQRDGSGKKLRAKLDCCTFLQGFGTNSDGEQFWIVEQATGLQEVGIVQLPLSSSCSIMATKAARTPQPNVFTPSNQHLDILQRFLLLYSSAFVVPTSMTIFGMKLSIKSSVWQTVGDITRVSTVDTQVLFSPWEGEPSND